MEGVSDDRGYCWMFGTGTEWMCYCAISLTANVVDLIADIDGSDPCTFVVAY